LRSDYPDGRSEIQKTTINVAGPGRLTGPLQTSERRARAERVRPPTLPSDASEKLCRQLISELEQLQNAEEHAFWAHRALPLKNQLSAKDAQEVEAAFAAAAGGAR
jgi:hypothetical protein